MKQHWDGVGGVETFGYLTPLQHNNNIIKYKLYFMKVIPGKQRNAYLP